MMRCFLLSIAVFLAIPTAQAADTLPQRYLAVYLKINDCEHLEHDQKYAQAAQGFRDCYAMLMKIHESDPAWESALVLHRLEDCHFKIRDLESAELPGQASVVPAKATDAEKDATLASLAGGPRNSYPWKTDIVTTLFWIGEPSTNSSAWDDNWTASNNGPDLPDNRSGYAPATHAASVNPFYVALPFNDLAYPDEAKKWVPSSWPVRTVNGKPASACKDRWIQIKNAEGRTCYAQWEDVGPEGNNKPGYVFGSEHPGDGPGLDVSPAVAQYLQLGQGNKSLTSWRFVDDQDVRPGQWLKYDEEAVIYRALHQIQKTGQ